MAVVEYIRYALDRHSGEELLAAYGEAEAQLRASPHTLGWELARCVDEPDRFILRIEWDSAEGHITGFRKGEHFPPFLKAIRPFVGEIEEMRHYETTAVRSQREA